MTTVGQRVVDRLVAAYQRHVSAGLNAENDTHCLYTPSCSAYAREALEEGGAFVGTIDALARLARCNGTFAERNREAFLSLLDDPSAHIEYAEPRAQAQVDAVRSRLQQASALRAEGHGGEAGREQAEAREMLRRTLHVALEDRPGRHDTRHFVVSMDHRASAHAHHAHAHHAQAPAPRSGLISAARSAVGTLVGGALGAVVGALAAGLLTGGVLAPLAATGRMHVLHDWLAPRVGAQGAEALGALADRATRPASFTRRLVARGEESSLTAGAVALVVGIPLGLVQGVVQGAAFGAFWGARAGRAV